jgi:hypothetical protein
MLTNWSIVAAMGTLIYVTAVAVLMYLTAVTALKVISALTVSFYSFGSLGSCDRFTPALAAVMILTVAILG